MNTISLSIFILFSPVIWYQSDAQTSDQFSNCFFQSSSSHLQLVIRKLFSLIVFWFKFLFRFHFWLIVSVLIMVNNNQLSTLNSSGFNISPIDDRVHPYYLLHSESPDFVLVSQLLTGDSYNSWIQAMQIALSLKNAIRSMGIYLVISPRTDQIVLLLWIHKVIPMSRCPISMTIWPRFSQEQCQ